MVMYVVVEVAGKSNRRHVNVLLQKSAETDLTEPAVVGGVVMRRVNRSLLEPTFTKCYR